jgi:hypothetical protein
MRLTQFCRFTCQTKRGGHQPNWPTVYTASGWGGFLLGYTWSCSRTSLSCKHLSLLVSFMSLTNSLRHRSALGNTCTRTTTSQIWQNMKNFWTCYTLVRTWKLILTTIADSSKGHCIEILRQAAICRGDVSIITMFWKDDVQLPIADFSLPHSCVNWNAIQEWSKQRSFDPMRPGYMKHPKLGKFANKRHAIFSCDWQDVTKRRPILRRTQSRYWSGGSLEA